MGKRGRKRKKRQKGYASAQRRGTRARAHRSRDPASRLVRRASDLSIPARDLVPDVQALPLRAETVPPETGFEVATRAGSERAWAIADASLANDPASVPALTFAAGVAEFEGDDRRAADLLGRALHHTHELWVRHVHADALVAAGDLRSALPEIERLCLEDPDDDSAQILYRDALRSAWERRALAADADCPCESGRARGDCCGPVEAAALERFADRRIFDRLRLGLATFAMRPEFERHRLMSAATWFDEVPAEIDPDDAMHRMYVEWSIVTLPDEADDEGRSILQRFADDPDTLEEHRQRAASWADHGVYGLWQVRRPEPDPGVHLVDLCTGTYRYAEVPPTMQQGLVPWVVMLGALVPIDGVWRVGSAVSFLSPSEADHMVGEVFDLAGRVLDDTTGRPRGRGAKRRPASLLDPRRATVPPSVGAGRTPPAPLPVARLLSDLMGAALPALLQGLEVRRSTPPRLVNMEGHPLIPIVARIRVRDATALRALLAAHPDVDAGDDVLVWLGDEMPPDQAAVAHAELQAFARRRGVELEPPGRPQRWSRGQVRLLDDEVILETNSRERSELFLDLLRSLGETPEVVDETRMDPSQDLVLTGGPGGLLLGGASAEAREAWAREWPDVPVPALDGLTPREAAAHSDRRPRLEGLLRELEFAAGCLRRAGEAAPDMAAVRVDLGMEDPYAWAEAGDMTDVGELDRRAWAVPPGRGRLGEIELALLHPDDPDDRGILIRAEHPELEEALEADLDTVRVGGHDVNPRLHLALHEAIANQLWEDDPPEVWQTAKRLLGIGYERHEVLHMLASTMTEELWQALQDRRPYDRARHVRSLQALPGDWEAARHRR